MESHIAAEIAAAHQIPFAACRVIIDAAHRALPSAAGAALDSNGSVDVFAVCGPCCRNRASCLTSFALQLTPASPSAP
jgi:hypothetical protein